MTRFVRLREDGSEISAFDSLYVLTHESERWGIKGRSSFAPWPDAQDTVVCRARRPRDTFAAHSCDPPTRPPPGQRALERRWHIALHGLRSACVLWTIVLVRLTTIAIREFEVPREISRSSTQRPLRRSTERSPSPSRETERSASGTNRV